MTDDERSLEALRSAVDEALTLDWADYAPEGVATDDGRDAVRIDALFAALTGDREHPELLNRYGQRCYDAGAQEARARIAVLEQLVRDELGFHVRLALWRAQREATHIPCDCGWCLTARKLLDGTAPR